jgi:glucose-1-phosphate thymidylyltransferase
MPRVLRGSSRLFVMDLRGVLVVEDALTEGGAPLPVPALEHVANEPIAHHVLDALEAAGVRRVVVASSERSAHGLRECLKTWKANDRVSLQYVSQHAPLEFSSALSLVAPVVEDAPCIFHAAGGLLGEPLAPLARCLSAGAPDAVLMVHQSSMPHQRLSAATQSLLNLAEIDPARSSLGVAGVWGFGPGAIRMAAGGGHAAGPLRPPGPRPDVQTADLVDLTQMAERIRTAGGNIQVRQVDAWRAYRGRAAELLDLSRLVLDQIATDLPFGVEAGNHIEGRVRIHPSATVHASVLVGPVVVGPGARIRDAYIGPFTSIGADASIEGAEIERSIIFGGAEVTHLGTRMTASIVGRNARLFRDFSLPRALRMCVGDSAEVGLC